MKQITGRRLIIIRLVGFTLFSLSVWMIVYGHATGAIEVGTRRSSIFLSGEDMWVGYLFWIIGASLSVMLVFVDLAHTKTHRLLSKSVGIAFFVALGLCFLKGADVL